MTEDKLSKLKSALFLTLESLQISKETFVKILETLEIPIIVNETIKSKDYIPSSGFRINNQYFSEFDYISFRDKFKITKYVRDKRDGREKILGGVYRLNNSSNVCRVIDFTKIDGEFIYTVERLWARLNSSEFYGIEKINEKDIGTPYHGVMTPYVDGTECRYEKWISPTEISKEEFY